MSMVSTNEFNGNWDEIKEKLRQKFVTLTDNDLLLTEDRHEEMLARIQFKLGKTKEEIQKLISQL